MRPRISFLGFGILGIALVLSGAGEARAQIGNKDALKKAYNDNDSRRRQLNGGDKATPKDKAVAEAVAQWHIYRITHKFEKLQLAQDEFTREINDASDKKNAAARRAYIDLLGPACVACMKDVLDLGVTREPTPVLYACQMLPTMARLKQKDVSEFLVKLIEDPKTHDAVRLHALKALKETMPIRQQLELWPLGLEDFKDKEQNLKRAHDVRNVDALAKYIEQPIKAGGMSQETMDVVRYLRREAIVSLAAAGSPAVTAHVKAPKQVEGLVAPTLMRVLLKDTLTPPPSIHEKIEAALGLCAMEYPFMPDYQSEVSVYLVGGAVVQFINEYNKDWVNFVNVGKAKKVPYLGWKGESRRFEAGLKQLMTNAPKGSPGAKSAKELYDAARPLLDQVTAYKQPDPARLEELSRTVPKLRPKVTSVFKNLKAPSIALD